MIAVVQRVARASVRVEGELVGEVGRGVLVLLGVLKGDGEAEMQRLARKVAGLRLFADERGRMQHDLGAIGGGALVVSQVTLAADGRKGRRLSLDRAAEPERARELYRAFAAELEALGVPTQRGRFGASMQVELVNDGPVTCVLEEPPRRPESSQALS